MFYNLRVLCSDFEAVISVNKKCLICFLSKQSNNQLNELKKKKKKKKK